MDYVKCQEQQVARSGHAGGSAVKQLMDAFHLLVTVYRAVGQTRRTAIVFVAAVEQALQQFRQRSGNLQIAFQFPEEVSMLCVIKSRT